MAVQTLKISLIFWQRNATKEITSIDDYFNLLNVDVHKDKAIISRFTHGIMGSICFFSAKLEFLEEESIPADALAYGTRDRLSDISFWIRERSSTLLAGKKLFDQTMLIHVWTNSVDIEMKLDSFFLASCGNAGIDIRVRTEKNEKEELD